MRTRSTAGWAAWLVAALALVAPTAGAFKLRPLGTDFDRALARLDEPGVGRLLDEVVRLGVELLAEPVHEEITHRAFLCDGQGASMDCAKQPSRRPRAPEAVLYGVHWNDNPPFQIKSTDGNRPAGLPASCLNQVIRIPRLVKDCWLPIYQSSERRAASRSYSARNGSWLIQRTHFGDLQFLHSMAAHPAEDAQTTQDNVLAWARFAFGVYREEFGGDDFLARCPATMRGCRLVGLPRIAAWFPGEMTVADLFTQGDETYRGNLREVALGSLLHLVQDSFSEAHVVRSSNQQNRPCGPAEHQWRSAATIQLFQTYGAQDSGRHAQRDAARAFGRGLLTFTPNVVEVATRVRTLMQDAPDWPVVERYLRECVFVVEDPTAQSGSHPDIERAD